VARHSGTPEELERYGRLAAEFMAQSPSTAKWIAMSDSEQDEWLRNHPNHEALSDEEADAWWKAHPSRGDDDGAEGEIYDLGGVYFNAGGEPVGGKYERPKPSRAGRGRPIRGKVYRGRKHDYGAEPWYRYRPENIVKAVEEGRLLHVDGTIAGAINDHNRRHKGQGQRIAWPVLAARIHVSVPTVKRSVRRMVQAREISIEASGRGIDRGAIYRFPPRAA
jgi:hypothetical protein